MKYLYEHLLATKQIVDIKHFKQEFLKISARKVLKLIQTNDNRWEKFVPKTLSHSSRVNLFLALNLHKQYN
jgi:hypothetical protein